MRNAVKQNTQDNGAHNDASAAPLSESPESHALDKNEKGKSGRINIPRSLIAVGLAVLATYLLWFCVWFAPTPAYRTAESLSENTADVIVVLTGGDGRVTLGLELLMQGVAPQLLVSGVFDSISDARFLEIWPEAETLLGCCITLGRTARDTRGNAQETARWLREYGGGRVLLVTSDYHLRRANLELRHHLPENVEITLLAVATNRKHPKVVAETFAESLKYLLTLVGGSRLGPWQLFGSRESAV